MAEYTIDAAGRSLGRVASEAAKALMGKTAVDYVPNKRSLVKVQITNAAKVRVSEKKRIQKSYSTYSGYPGGLKRERLGALSARKGNGELLRRAVYRMLPNNTFRPLRMKNLRIDA